MKKTLLAVLLVLFAADAYAQDMLIYKDKTVEEVKVLEVTPDFIKYREFGAPEDAVILSVERDYLNKVVFESGRVMDMSKAIMDDARVYAGQRDHAIKFDVQGFSTNYLLLTYEKSIDPSTSWEAGFSAIGAGYEADPWWGNKMNPMGLGLTAGYKFKRSPNFYMQRMRFSHIMRGAYIKPTLWLNFFNYDLTDYDHPPDPVTFQYPVTRESATAFSGMLEFGNQLVFSDLFLVDYFAGIGYGYTTNQSEYNYSNYGFWGGAGTWSYSSPVTFNFGLKVGYLMK